MGPKVPKFRLFLTLAVVALNVALALAIIVVHCYSMFAFVVVPPSCM